MVDGARQAFGFAEMLHRTAAETMHGVFAEPEMAGAVDESVGSEAGRLDVERLHRRLAAADLGRLRRRELPLHARLAPQNLDGGILIQHF